MCGEHSFTSAGARARTGSSPRVWGAPVSHYELSIARRLIPTCVGSTQARCTPQGTEPAHPHVCGEHPGSIDELVMHRGSSPRVWGAHRFPCTRIATLRLIPTCVGSTPIPVYSHSNPAAHPHVCGEHALCLAVFGLLVGSSPRVWGAPLVFWVCIQSTRLIPTCVGSTSRNTTHGTPSTAHPHVCGEHSPCGSACPGFVGSSPRVWGAHLLTWDFIPTHQVLELVWSPKPVLTLHDFWAYRRREARLYLLALLHPFRGPRSSFGADGRIISFTPSKSTGSHG